MTTLSTSSVSKDMPRHRLSDAALEKLAARVEALNTADAHAGRQAVRQAALEALKQRGFPSRKDEDWQYTPLDALLSLDFNQRSAEAVEASALEHVAPPFEVARLVFVDGVFQPQLSDALPEGVSVVLISETDETQLKAWQQLASVERDPFELLNLALLKEGVSFKVSSVVETPVVLLHLTTGADQLASVRHTVQIASGAQLTLIEQHERLQDAPVLNNCVIEADVAEGAHYRHLKLQRDSHQGFHMAHHFVRQQGNSGFASFYAALGGAVSRHFTHTCLLGEQASMDVNSAGLATGDQVMDTRTYTDHASAHCTSRQVHKLVVDDSARGVFDGMIHVARGAQKTDGLMDNKNLLLGPKAKVDAKPRLEIYADDVKCSHGSATGQLDPNQLFYARARGIDKETARLLITTAFLTEPMDGLANEVMRTWLQQALTNKLQG